MNADQIAFQEKFKDQMQTHLNELNNNKNRI